MGKSEFKTLKLKDGLMITRYTGNQSEVIFPAYIDGQKVVSIGSYVFTVSSTFCGIVPGKAVVRVIIPETVRTIEDVAFYKCQKLEHVKLHPHITFIGNLAFAYCNNLKILDFGMGKCSLGTVYFPPALLHIGVNAFTKGNFCMGITRCIFQEVRVCSSTKLEKPQIAAKHRNTFDYNGCRLYSYDRNSYEKFVNIRDEEDIVLLDLESDFGFQLYFEQKDFEHLPLQKLEKHKVVREYENVFSKKYDVHVSLCEMSDLIRFLRLSAAIPVFDSYDSMYDRWHNLYLIWNPEDGAYDAVYAVGGYARHSVSGYKRLKKIPDILAALTSDWLIVGFEEI